MKKELQEELYQKYPKIFRQKDLTPKETAMCWGITVSDHWYSLVDTLCLFIKRYCEDNKPLQIEAIQVKQKFGGLRFYVIPYIKEVENVINFAMNISYLICEECGSTDDVQTTSSAYVQSLCKKCRKKLYEGG